MDRGIRRCVRGKRGVLVGPVPERRLVARGCFN